MAQILVRDLDPDTVARLKLRAGAHRRSLQSEVRVILEEAARETKTPDEKEAARLHLLAFSDALRERLMKETGLQEDSTEFIRGVREHGRNFGID